MTHWLRFVLGPLALVAVVTSVSGQTLREYQAKGAFLVNFARFIEWPSHAFEHPDGALAICFGGDPGIAADLESAIRNRRAGSHELHLRHTGSSGRCHLLFVTATESLEQGLRAATPFTVTVGEHSQFLKAGGHIQLFMDGSQIRFDIASSVVGSTNFVFSSQLLALAQKPRRSSSE
jgi:hypothetical protein